MKYFRILTTLAVLIYSLHLTFPQITYAYLDPGTGSYILQMIIAGLLGASYAIKIYWGKIKTYFTGFLQKANKPKP